MFNKPVSAKKVVSPGQVETLSLKAPAEQGEDSYLCTFPGPGTVMRGIMRVRTAGEKREGLGEEKISGAKLVDALKASAVASQPRGTRLRPYACSTAATNTPSNTARRRATSRQSRRSR